MPLMAGWLMMAAHGTEPVEVRKAESVTVRQALPSDGTGANGAAPSGSGAELSVPEASLESAFAARDEAASDLGSQRAFQITLETGVLADDNVFLSAREQVSDVLYHISPAVRLSLGDATERQDSFLTVNYKPEAFFFHKRHEENTVDHTAGIATRKKFAKLAVDAAAQYQRTNGSSVDLGGRIPRDIWQASAGLTYGWGVKTSFSTAVIWNATRYHQSGFADSEQWTHEGFVDYQVTEKTRIGAGGAWGQLKVAGEAGRQDFQQALARAHYQATDKVELGARAGAEWRQTEAGSTATPVFGVDVRYQAAEGTRLKLQGARDVMASGDQQGQNYTRTAVGAGLEQKVGEPFTLTLDAGWEHYAYTSASRDAGAAGRRDNSYFVRPAFLYTFADHWRAELWYQWRSTRSNVEDQTYDVQQLGVNIRYEF